MTGPTVSPPRLPASSIGSLTKPPPAAIWDACVLLMSCCAELTTGRGTLSTDLHRTAASGAGRLLHHG
jgi:hypothetical protein